MGKHISLLVQLKRKHGPFARDLLPLKRLALFILILRGVSFVLKLSPTMIWYPWEAKKHVKKQEKCAVKAKNMSCRREMSCYSDLMSKQRIDYLLYDIW